MSNRDINITGSASVQEFPGGRIVVHTPTGDIEVPTGASVTINGQVVVEGNPDTMPPPAPRQRQAQARQNPEFVEIHRVEELVVNKYIPEEEIKTWKEVFCTYCVNNEEVYQELRAFKAAKKALWYKGWVTISGHPGDGKSSTAERLLVKFVRKPFTYGRDATPYDKGQYREHSVTDANRGMYEWVKVNSPEEWRQKIKPDTDQIVLIDDIFGPASFNMAKIEPWKPILSEIYTQAISRRPHLLVIITLHKHQLEKLPPELKGLALFNPDLVIDLSDSKYNLESHEKTKVLEANCSFYHHGLSYRDQDDLRYANVNQSFPLACRMYAQIRSFHMEGQIYFKNPDKSFENVIQKVFNFDKAVYFTLASAVLFDGFLELDKYSFEDYSDRQQNIFRQLKQILEIPDDVDLAKMRFAAQLMNGVFFYPKYLHCWQFSHERIFHLVADAVARKIPKKMVELCSLDFMMDRYRTSNYFGGNLESTIHVWNNEYPEFCQRFTFEILTGNVRTVACHASLSDQRFAEAWFKFMSDMGSLLPVALQKGPYNRSLFYWACYYGHEPTARQFLNHEDLAEVREEQWFKDEKSISLLAAVGGYSITGSGTGKVVKLLLESGVPLDVKETLTEEDILELFGKETAYLVKIKAPVLHIAAMRCNFETINNIIEKGADLNEVAEDGLTPLHRAASNREDGAVRAFMKLKANVNVNAESPTGKKPLHIALATGLESQIRQIHWGGSPFKDANMDDGRSFLYAATTLDEEKVVRMIMNNISVYRGNPSKDPWSPLHEAVALGNEDIAKLLIDRDVDVNDKCSGGWSPLHFAVLFYNDKMVKLLVEKKADINIADHNRKTPLHLACELGYVDICNYLLDKGAKPELLTSDGEFPVTLAAKNGHKQLVKLLIKEGIELEMPKEREDKPEERDDLIRMMMMMRGHKYRDFYK